MDTTAKALKSERFADSHMLQSQLTTSRPSIFHPEAHSPSGINDIQQTSNDDEEIFPPFHDLLTETSGCRVAALFAYQAKITLHDQELYDLEKFLVAHKTPQDATFLRSQLSNRLHLFYTAELLESGQSRDRLARPSGPENADIGILMHCHSKEGKIDECWDTDSMSIQAMTQKGLSHDFAFFYDWHWRAESSARGRGRCPATKWSKSLRSLHDALSSDLLDILPLPLLVVAGDCAKSHYRKTLSSKTRRLNVRVSSETILEFDLDFNVDGLRRITGYMIHPSAIYFPPTIHPGRTLCQDAVLNFFLWLVGQKSEKDTFRKQRAMCQRGVPGAAPLALFWSHVEKEKEFGRLLVKYEVDTGLWTWAGSYLKEDPATFLERGESFLTKVRQRFSDRRRISDSRMVNCVTVRASANRKIALGRFEDRVREYWDNQDILITKNGDFRIYVHKDQRGPKLRTVPRFYSIVQKAEKDLTIHFAYEGITLKLGEKIVFEKSREKLVKSKEGVEWIKQLNKEVVHKQFTNAF